MYKKILRVALVRDGTGPDKTKFLSVHDIEIDTFISQFSATNTIFIHFFLR
jgi:hypothetical protein